MEKRLRTLHGRERRISRWDVSNLPPAERRRQEAQRREENRLRKKHARLSPEALRHEENLLRTRQARLRQDQKPKRQLIKEMEVREESITGGCEEKDDDTTAMDFSEDEEAVESRKLNEGLQRYFALLEPDAIPTANSAVDFSIRRSTALSMPQIKSCFNLIKETSMVDYEMSSLGWDEQAKRKEMLSLDMFYILVHPTLHFKKDASNADDPESAPDRPVLGFLSFMITDDEPYKRRPVLYIYELHLREEVRGVGVGSSLMKTAEDLTQLIGIKKVMLTVFSTNLLAYSLYLRAGYKVDRCSPKGKWVRCKKVPPEYYIMMKEMIHEP